jgi:hypothetical protein
MIVDVCRTTGKERRDHEEDQQYQQRLAVMRRIENHQMCWESSTTYRHEDKGANTQQRIGSLFSTSQFKGELNDNTDTIR